MMPACSIALIELSKIHDTVVANGESPPPSVPPPEGEGSQALKGKSGIPIYMLEV